MADEPISTPGAAAPAAAPAPTVTPLELPAAPRGRGRPKKPLGLSRPPAAAGNAGGSGSPAAPGSQPANSIAVNVWDGANCKDFAELPYMAAAVATGWKGWELEPLESERLGKILARVLNRLLPEGGEYADYMALFATGIAITGTKYACYREYMEEKTKNAGPAK